MKSVAARNPKLVHGVDQIKGNRGKDKEERGKGKRGKEKTRKGVTPASLPFPSSLFPGLKDKPQLFRDSHSSERPSDEPNRFRF
jgi:hypothetical protein